MNPESETNIQKTDAQKLADRLPNVILSPYPVVQYPDLPTLRLSEKSKPCINFDVNLDILFGTLLSTLKATKGVGISAIQVGIPFQACVVQLPGREPIFAANARIVEAYGDLKCLGEGCLSMPGSSKRYFTVPVWRKEEVTVEFQDIDGVVRRVAAEGLEARVWQHEIDHANGTLIIDKVNSFRKKECLKKYEQIRARAL